MESRTRACVHRSFSTKWEVHSPADAFSFFERVHACKFSEKGEEHRVVWAKFGHLQRDPGTFGEKRQTNTHWKGLLIETIA